jgi:hypothetical protein
MNGKDPGKNKGDQLWNSGGLASVSIRKIKAKWRMLQTAHHG